MPSTPVRTVGEPLDHRDVLEALKLMEDGRLQNPAGPHLGEAIDAVLQTDYPVSGHGDDLYLYEEDDLEYRDAEDRHVGPRRRNPASAQSHEGQPPDPHWRLKTKLPAMSLKVKRSGGDFITATWRGMALLMNGNSKVQCYNWSIPEGAACPGRSAFCSDCYAVAMARGTKRASMMGSRLMRLKAWAEHRADWLAEMTAECKFYGARAPVRIHVAGDFFGADYTNDWIKVIKACPQTHFWAYTRSWAADRGVKGGPELLSALEELRALPNMTLYASFDPTMRTPPKGWLWAGIYGDPRLGWEPRTSTPTQRSVMICPEIAGAKADWKHIGEDGSGVPPLFGKEPHLLPARATCRSCGWCWNKDVTIPVNATVAKDIAFTGVRPMVGARGDVAFPRHGSALELPEPGSIPWPSQMPTKEQVRTYSIYRNGKKREKKDGRETGRWVLGEGNHVVYSDAMIQLKRSQAKVEAAKNLADMEMGRVVHAHDVLYTKDVLDKDTGEVIHRRGEVMYKKGSPTADSHMAVFYRKEFADLLAGARVANKQIEQFWKI